MKITIVGSADAFNSAGRCHSCYLLEEVGCATMMIDFGATALQALKKMSYDHRNIDILCFTHMHADHFGGLPFWLLDSMYRTVREKPITIIGPIGVKEAIMRFLDVSYPDLSMQPQSFLINYIELLPAEDIHIEGWNIAAFAADHMDLPHKPLSFRITNDNGKTIAFSGDTTMCDQLIKASDGADLLIADCTAMHHPAGRHCVWDDWTNNFVKFNTNHIVLSHLSDEVRTNSPHLTGPADVNLQFADDGMVIEL